MANNFNHVGLHTARGIWKRCFQSEKKITFRPHFVGGIWKRNNHASFWIYVRGRLDLEITWSSWRLCFARALYSAANDPRPQMIPRPEMIPKLDGKWSRTANDPRCALQMIPLEYEEWHGVWFPGIFQFFILIFIFTSFSSTKLLIRWT